MRQPSTARRPRRRALAVLVTALAWLATLALATGDSGRLVLCLGAEDHRAIELAHSGSCETVADVADPSVPEVANTVTLEARSGTAACLDLPIGSEPIAAGAGGPDPVSPTTGVASEPPLALACPGRCALARWHARARPAGLPALHLRSTVLRV